GTLAELAFHQHHGDGAEAQGGDDCLDRGEGETEIGGCRDAEGRQCNENVDQPLHRAHAPLTHPASTPCCHSISGQMPKAWWPAGAGKTAATPWSVMQSPGRRQNGIFTVFVNNRPHDEKPKGSRFDAFAPRNRSGRCRAIAARRPQPRGWP